MIKIKKFIIVYINEFLVFSNQIVKIFTDKLSILFTVIRMRYLVILILIVGAAFLYSSVSQSKDMASDSTLVEEYSASWLTDLSEVQAKAKEEGKTYIDGLYRFKLVWLVYQAEKRSFFKACLCGLRERALNLNDG
jgi:hypothetical protein